MGWAQGPPSTQAAARDAWRGRAVTPTDTSTRLGDSKPSPTFRHEHRAAPGQHGTYQYPRTGWCPGAIVYPWDMDVTADLSAASLAGTEAFTVAWTPEDYVNSCRPDANPCTGCALGTGCAYDGNMHTAPRWMLSGILIGLR